MSIDDLFIDLNSKDNTIRKTAFDNLLDITEQKVDWIYDKWDILVEKMNASNSYQRTIGICLLSNLAKSDKEEKFFEIMNQYLTHMEDEKFITSRQCIQNAWKPAIISQRHCQFITDYYEKMYFNNKHLQKHANLIRIDIANSLLHIYQHTREKTIEALIDYLNSKEMDPKVSAVLNQIRNV